MSDDQTVEITMSPETLAPQNTIVSDNIQLITCQTDKCGQEFTNLQLFEEHMNTHVGEQRNEKGQFVKGHASSQQDHRPCEFCKRKEEILKITEEYLAPYLKSISTDKPTEPLKEILALKIGVSDRTVDRWVDKDTSDSDEDHSQFCHLISLLMTCAKAYNLRRLNGRYNARGAEFKLARMHGLIETSKTVHAGEVNEPLQIIITEEDRKKDGE